MKLLALFALLIAMGSPVAADILKIETNNWNRRVPLIWTAKLTSLDRQTGLARFEFVNRGERETLDIHFTRIYSVTFDDQETVNKPFPPTRRNLATPLGRIPRSQETISLFNNGFLSASIPPDVIVIPDRTAPEYLLSGGVAELEPGNLELEALDISNDIRAFSIPEASMRNWIRGR